MILSPGILSTAYLTQFSTGLGTSKSGSHGFPSVAILHPCLTAERVFKGKKRKTSSCLAEREILEIGFLMISLGDSGEIWD